MTPSQPNSPESTELAPGLEASEDRRESTRTLRAIAVPAMLFLSSVLMAVAWLGHLRFEDSHFLVALAIAWLIVLPEYMLNVGAVRLGKGIYSGATMASFNLCSGVICVVLVSRFLLGESMNARQYVGFALMIVAMLLIASQGHMDNLPDIDEDDAP